MKLSSCCFLVFYITSILHATSPDTLVGTYYYPWHTGSNFHGPYPPGSTTLRFHLDPQQVPELGWYNQYNSKVISQHYDWGKYAGIDFFVCSYWGKGKREDNVIRYYMMNNPDRDNVKLCVFLEPSLTPQGGASTTKMKTEMEYLCDHYFDHPSYLRIDNKPVIFIYVTRAMSDSDLTRCLDTIRNAARNKGIGEVYIVGDEVWGTPNIKKKTPRVSQMDAITNYDVYGNLGRARYVTDVKLDTWQSRNQAWKDLTDVLDKQFIPAISPGFNDRAVRGEVDHPACSRKLNNKDHALGTLFSGMLERLDPTTDMLMITSWNEWHEDTQIEPVATAPPISNDDALTFYTEGLEYEGYGTLYLDILRDYFVEKETIAVGASAQSENPPHETAEKAFDGSIHTKWVGLSPEDKWIQYRYAENHMPHITEYAITSANDYTARDPSGWKLLGSNDGINWDLLDTRTDVNFTDRGQTMYFSVSNPGNYNIYKLSITHVRYGRSPKNSVQIAEIDFQD